MEVGVENDGNFAQHPSDVATVRGNEVDAVPVRVMDNEIAGNAKDFSNSTLLYVISD